ncbi:MAG: molybdopterin-dependent oxidoreductase [Proteobacteria bacterium]|nr:molybdopterin-dependent oxidoreductase [Pseudomonadota bacterium]
MALEPEIRIGSRPAFASLVPFGPGRPRDRSLADAASAAWRSRGSLRFGLDVLRYGVCTTCELGSHGWRDDAIAGTHVCHRRLGELHRWTRPAFVPAKLPRIDALQAKTAAQLEELGRIPVPLLRRTGEPRLEPISWNDAQNLVATRLRERRSPWAMLLNPSETTNEGLFCLKRLADAADSPHIDLLEDAGSRLIGSVLQWTAGLEAATCTLQDIPRSDLVVLWGTGLHRHPFLSRLIALARQRGARVVAIGPVRENEFDGVWLPGELGPTLFGARLVDEHARISGGGDRHLAWGILKALTEFGGLADGYLKERVAGWARIKPHLRSLRWSDLRAGSGLSAHEIRHIARIFAGARRSVLLLGSALGRGPDGTKTVGDILTLTLGRGWLGTPGSGVLPLDGCPGVRGARDLGLGPDLGSRGGWKADEIVDAGRRGGLGLLYVVGPGLADRLPPDRPRCLEETAVRVHQGHFLDPSMLLQPGEATLILPAQSRFEQRGGGTTTAIDRRIRFSPEILGHAIGEARPDWQIALQIEHLIDPDGGSDFKPLDAAAVRERIAVDVPAYAGIERLHAPGAQLLWGGATLHADGFATTDGRARIPPVDPPGPPRPGIRLTTRRTGGERDAVYVSGPLARRLGFEDGDPVVIKNEWGELRGVIRIAPVADDLAHTYWPEGRCLYPHGPHAARAAGSPLVVHLEAP